MKKTQALTDVSNLLRRDCLRMTTKAGSGHPTSCMSCAEIVSVLFFHEMRYDVGDPNNPDMDEFVLSKGHAAPILYAALHRAGCTEEDPMTLRQFGSPYEGHPMPSALPWVKVATGSLGQGLSVGVGMAFAARLRRTKNRICVLLGDSEAAEGSVWEAAEIASHAGLKNLCAIVDVNRLGQSRPTMLEHDMRTYRRRFEAFGWNAIVVNGHSVEALLDAFSRAKAEKQRPTVILAKTFKGRGVSFLEDKEGWHGTPVGKADLEKALSEIPEPTMPQFKITPPRRSNGQSLRSKPPKPFQYEKGKPVATRDAYGNALARLAETDPLLVALDGEVSNSTKSDKILKTAPERYIEGYIAEQNLVGMALGLSAKGFRPFASTFAAFFTRAHDQIRMAALSSAGITFVGSHAGVSIGEDGPSQMGLDDLAMFRALPGSMVLYPSDAVSTERLVELALATRGINYIRTTRPKTPVIYDSGEAFAPGDFKVVRQSGNDQAVLVGAGVTLHEALRAHESLSARGINVAVIDCYCLKPFDAAKFIQVVENSGRRVVVAEDHHIEGGLGEMICRALSGSGVPVICLAVEKLPHSGPAEALLADQGIDAKSITRAVSELLERAGTAAAEAAPSWRSA
jgi:transketolase